MDTQKALFNLNLEKAIPDLVKEKLEVMKPWSGEWATIKRNSMQSFVQEQDSDADKKC
jgi:hypothetical protein